MFYYLLVGASEDERREFRLLQPEEYFYLKQVKLIYSPSGPQHPLSPELQRSFALRPQQNFAIEDADDLRHDFERLQQAMEMVGFLPTTKRQ